MSELLDYSLIFMWSCIWLMTIGIAYKLGRISAFRYINKLLDEKDTPNE